MQSNIPCAKIYFIDYHTLIIGKIIDTKPHTHHALQLLLSTKGNFTAIVDGKKITCNAIILDQDVKHQIIGDKGEQLLILIDADANIKQSCRDKYFKDHPYKIIENRLELENEVNKITSDNVFNMAQAIIKEHMGVIYSINQQVDSRILESVKTINRTEYNKISLNKLSEISKLSEGRFTHLFKEEIGIPIRKYLLWRRLLEAVELIKEGSSFTDAAYEAGFSDSPHLCRTFKDSFGLTLRTIFNNSQFIQLFFCEATYN